MRLIDADELIRKFTHTVNGERLSEDFMETINFCHKDIVWLIEREPTAYDVDRVVKELKNAKCSRSFECAEFRQKAIEIVKAGGIDD